jgi:hypothetical protein
MNSEMTSGEEAPHLAQLLEVWQGKAQARMAVEDENRKMAAAMLGRLISMGVDDLETVKEAGEALNAMLRDLLNREIKSKLGR